MKTSEVDGASISVDFSICHRGLSESEKWGVSVTALFVTLPLVIATNWLAAAYQHGAARWRNPAGDRRGR